MKNTFLALLCATLFCCSCSNNDVRVGGKFFGLTAKSVYLEQMTASGQTIIDSVELAKDGSYRFVIKNAPQTPSIYNIIYNNERIPLLLTAGENVTVGSMGSVLVNYTVSGSKESELLREFNREYIAGMQALNAKVAAYAEAGDSSKTEIAQLYTAKLREIKRNQISFIIKNKSSIAAVYALYQRLPDEKYLVNSESDLIYFRTVADAVSKRYPTSPFVITLRNDVARMEAQTSLLSTIEERDYPDIVADDMYGNKVKLSELEGNVILVDFWAAELGNSNALNADLKSIYEKYEADGFRVYQVSFDTSKATWIKAVQEQKLPWVSVCDFRGQASPIMGVYNVRSLPSNYLIDRKGRIVAKNIYSDALEQELAKILK
ncbi:MAG: AhpC/TSA family protein [Rikenellaceae bacterium]|nr:AhpC/TSA family protein [Rikenellaceae bacterium]